MAGLDAIERRLDPGPPADTPYQVSAPLLPKSLAEPIEASRASEFFNEQFGTGFGGYLLPIKQAELARFEAEVLSRVSEWEQREYFDIFRNKSAIPSPYCVLIAAPVQLSGLRQSSINSIFTDRCLAHIDESARFMPNVQTNMCCAHQVNKPLADEQHRRLRPTRLSSRILKS